VAGGVLGLTGYPLVFDGLRGFWPTALPVLANS
jgi:hypothetical protein